MKHAFIVVMGVALISCSDRSSQQSSDETSVGVRASPAAEPAEKPEPARQPEQTLSLWQSVGLMVGLPEKEAETLITRVLGDHRVVASDKNVKDFVGALLRFRDQDNVSPERVLACMDTGVRSPTGPQWQDTIAYCVTELAG